MGTRQNQRSPKKILIPLLTSECRVYPPRCPSPVTCRELIFFWCGSGRSQRGW